MKMTKQAMKSTIENLKIKSKASVKKTIILALTGAFVLTGIAATQLPQSVAQAAAQSFHYRGNHNGNYNQNFNVDIAAQDLADVFGLDKQTILDYNAKGWRFRDLDHASFIAYVSKKSLPDVLNAKTVTNSWRDVSDSFGITWEQSRAAHQSLMSKTLATDLQLDESTVNNLLNDGYRPGDIAMASTISKKADQSFNNVLIMKKINNSWYDVATSLGLSDQEYRDCRDNANGHFRGRNSDGKFNRNRGGVHCGYYGSGNGWHNGPRR